MLDFHVVNTLIALNDNDCMARGDLLSDLDQEFRHEPTDRRGDLNYGLVCFDGHEYLPYNQ